MSVHSAVRDALKDYKHYIETNDFNTFFEKVQENYTHRTTNAICNMFFDANIEFIPYMSYLPEGCFELSTLSNFDVPSNIQRICFKCFSSSDIKQILIPSNVYELEEECFEACYFLKYVQIDEGCRNIGDSCFYDCESLESIILPSSLQSFGTTVFYGCDALKTIQYNGTVEDWKKIRNSDHINDNTSRLKKIQCVDGIIQF